MELQHQQQPPHVPQQKEQEVQLSEWTCVALGSGVKCLNYKNMSAAGDCVHDMHAEVICRRSFIRFVLQELHRTATTKDSAVFMLNTSTSATFPFSLKEGLKFHMYISQAPCGDASMESILAEQTEQQREINDAKKRKYEEQLQTNHTTHPAIDETNPAKKSRRHKQQQPPLDRAIERRQYSQQVILPQEFLDALTRGTVIRGRNDLQKLGCLRTKPGRVDSEVSISMSCRLAGWISVMQPQVCTGKYTLSVEQKIYLRAFARVQTSIK